MPFKYVVIVRLFLPSERSAKDTKLVPCNHDLDLIANHGDNRRGHW